MSKKLFPGMTITLADGRRAKIKQMLGEGGQGWVYLVECPETPTQRGSVVGTGEVARVQKCLKWYKKCPSEKFYNNLMKNAAEGAPSPHFIWPQAVTRKQFGSFGYLMDLRPEGYYEFSQFRLAKVRFQSFAVILRACMQTCEAFKLLHLKGLSYQDLNDGNFFVNPTTGDVCICDNDNVFPHGEESGILGKARYMAPEVVSGETLPNTFSDRFSLAVILFMFMFIDHPFEGENVLKYPCLTEALEQRLFGKELCFIFDKSNRNPPVKGVHANVATFWNMWPETLKLLFVNEFSADKLQHPDTRLTELEWMQHLMQVRDLLIKCPHCGDESFVGRQASGLLERLTSSKDKCLNPRCRKEIPVEYYLTSANRHVPLLPNISVFADSSECVLARVIRHPNDPTMMLMQNLELKAWQIVTPTGKLLTVEPRGFMPVKAGIRIQTGGDKLIIES